jgi:hypothetical protein
MGAVMTSGADDREFDRNVRKCTGTSSFKTDLSDPLRQGVAAAKAIIDQKHEEIRPARRVVRHANTTAVGAAAETRQTEICLGIIRKVHEKM